LIDRFSWRIAVPMTPAVDSLCIVLINLIADLPFFLGLICLFQRSTWSDTIHLVLALLRRRAKQDRIGRPSLLRRGLTLYNRED
jgi:hypothetical protein